LGATLIVKRVQKKHGDETASAHGRGLQLEFALGAASEILNAIAIATAVGEFLNGKVPEAVWRCNMACLDDQVARQAIRELLCWKISGWGWEKT